MALFIRPDVAGLKALGFVGQLDDVTPTAVSGFGCHLRAFCVRIRCFPAGVWTDLRCLPLYPTNIGCLGCGTWSQLVSNGAYGFGLSHCVSSVFGSQCCSEVVSVSRETGGSNPAGGTSSTAGQMHFRRSA